MAFDLSTVTTVGSTMLAKATVGNKLIIDGCGISDDVYTLEQAQALPLFSGTMESNRADIVGFTTNHVVFRASFSANDTYGGTRHSLILFGHMQNDDVIKKRAIAVCSDTDGFVLPKTTDVVNNFECLFTIQYALDPNVVTVQTSALETSKAEFDAFKADVVTREGEQDINGDKTFNGKVSLNSTVALGEDAAFTGSIKNGTTNIGSNGLYTKNITTDVIDADFRIHCSQMLDSEQIDCVVLDVTGRIFADNISPMDPERNIVSIEGNVLGNGNISTAGDVSGENLKADVLVESKNIKATSSIESAQTISKQVVTNNIEAYETGTIQLGGTDATENVVVNCPLKINGKVTASQVNASSVSASDDITTFNVKAANLNGRTPAPEYLTVGGATIYPIGSLVLMIKGGTGYESFVPGITFYVEENTTKVAHVYLDEMTGTAGTYQFRIKESDDYVPVGMYRVIVGGKTNSSQGKVPVLAMRMTETLM